MKLSIFIIIILVFTSCVGRKKALNSWLGGAKQDLIRSWGPPDRTTSDGGKGEILIYAHEDYNSISHLTYYQYTMFYVYEHGTVYHWLTKTGTVPPRQLDVRVLYFAR